jgi:hypothetical protein
MLWKTGLLISLVGLTLTFASCAFFGRAIEQASEKRQVRTVEIQPGRTSDTGAILADPGTQAAVSVEAELQLGEQAVEGHSDRGTILQFTLPVNYRVSDDSGAAIHVESGRLTGSLIVPAQNSPHRDAFEPVAGCTYRGSKFTVPETGSLRVSVELPPTDGDGNTVTLGRVVVSDRLPRSTGRWVAGGMASFVLGPVVAMLGVLLFIVGLFTRKRPADAG